MARNYGGPIPDRFCRTCGSASFLREVRDSTVDVNLNAKVAIVTGGSRGIGGAIVRELARHGARVAIGYLELAESAAGVTREVVAEGGEALAVQVDVTDSASVQAMMELCVNRWGRIDILINNAGVVSAEMVEDMPESAWRRVIDVNLTGPFLCCKAVLPVMLRQGYGKIVNVASVAGKRISYNGSAAYTASKAGLLAFTRHLAYEVAPKGINVNAICPGPTLTRMTERLASPKMLRERERLVPKNRLGTPEDHANAVLFLVSDFADYVCGTAIDVDGGSLLGWYDVETYRARRRHATAG